MAIIVKNEDKPRKKNGCLGTVIAFLIVYVIFNIVVGKSIGEMFTSSPTNIEDKSIYQLDLKGQLVEQAQQTNPFADVLSEFSMQTITEVVGLDDILSNITLAKEDNRIVGIYLKGGELLVQPACAKAIRDALLDFKQSGKFVVAYAANYSNLNYYIASAADTIYLNPVGHIAWDGLSAQKIYYKRLLEKIGVEMQIVKVGSFKSAVEPYFRSSMSDEDRKQTLQYVDGIWNEMVSAVAQSRNITPRNLNVYADECLSLKASETYVDYGLVDKLVYVQALDSILSQYAGTPHYHLLTTSKLSEVKRSDSNAADKIAVLYAEGDIVTEGVGGISEKQMIKTIKKIYKDSSIKAVVLRVNSPGGSADASEQIWHAIKTLQDKGLPVVVSMGDYAASGGYYISANADFIYAEPTTLTGSIGIFGTVPNLKELRSKIGVDIDEVKTNQHANFYEHVTMFGMNDKEYALMQSMVENGYELFVKRCADGRKMSVDAIKAIGEGRVWLGKDAVEIGLVDSLGNINDAICKAAQLASISQYTLDTYPEKKDPWLEMLEILEGTSPEEKMVADLKEFVSQPRIMTLTPMVVIK